MSAPDTQYLPPQPDAPPTATGVDGETAQAPGGQRAPMTKKEKRSHWVPDELVTACNFCRKPFTITERRHHCRLCGDIFCDTHSVFRARNMYSPDKPSRLCFECVLAQGCKDSNVALKPPEDVVGPVEIDVNQDMTVTDKHIERRDHYAAVTALANAKMSLHGCHVQGVEKGSSGHIRITNCYLYGVEIGLEVGGNNTVELEDCVIVGSEIGIHLKSNARLTARNCYVLANGEKGIGIRLSGGTTAELTSCVVAGVNGVVIDGTASHLNVTGGSISGKCGLIESIPGLFNKEVGIAGPHTIEGTDVVGARKDRFKHEGGTGVV